MKSAAEREQTEGERERAREERGGERSEREHAAVTYQRTAHQRTHKERGAWHARKEGSRVWCVDADEETVAIRCVHVLGHQGEELGAFRV